MEMQLLKKAPPLSRALEISLRLVKKKSRPAILKDVVGWVTRAKWSEVSKNKKRLVENQLEYIFLYLIL